MRGLFITFEGIEGGGKTTQINNVAKQLHLAGKQVLLTREPGGTLISEAIRQILLSKDLPPMQQDTELLLMFAARAEHLHTKILPALKAGAWVLCDRFTDASYAYQGGGRGIAIERIEALEAWVQGDCRPDYTFLFDLEPKIGLSRAEKRGEMDRFEEETINFFNRVRAKYLEMAQHDVNRYRIVDAQYERPQVQQQVNQFLNKIIEQHG
ncbi:MAG: dTMP kinase [Cocleimonas sp.]|nr:dTMP kinase [Cocleimonas sp.]